MITGEFKCSLDDKGRLMVPVKMRNEIIGNLLILTRGVDQCLWLFPLDEWKRVSENLLNATSLFQKRARLIRRRIIAPAQEIEIDKSGRIMVPPTLRDYAGLKKDCVVLGVERSIEIWDADLYQQYCLENEDEFQEAVEELDLS
ncbi:MAG: division/cell wall cluster transcriptional repressor MraZ [Spirochaetales bacterium]|nr:division/cell wall cluster transcriptional repressor MraZ [Spirochaetales bacterium]